MMSLPTKQGSADIPMPLSTEHYCTARWLGDRGWSPDLIEMLGEPDHMAPYPPDPNILIACYRTERVEVVERGLVALCPEPVIPQSKRDARNYKQRQRYRSDPAYRERMKTRARMWKQAQRQMRSHAETMMALNMMRRDGLLGSAVPSQRPEVTPPERPPPPLA